MKEIKCRISTVQQVTEDTLYINIDANEKFDARDFLELKRAALKLGEGKSFYNIISIGAATLPTRKAREISCSVEGSYYKMADAFVVNTFPQRMFCKLMMRINKPVVPTQCFENVREAETWLKQLKEEKVMQSTF